jgi:hypothetical protein
MMSWYSAYKLSTHSLSLQYEMDMLEVCKDMFYDAL